MTRIRSKLYYSLPLMAILLSLILLWCSEALSYAGIILLFLLLIPSEILVLEKRYFAVILNVLIPGCIILILPFSHYAWLIYISITGWYPLVRSLFSGSRSIWVGSLLAFLFCNFSAAICLVLLHFIGINPLTGLDLFWIVILITFTEIGFALFDVVYHLFKKLYDAHFKHFLLN